MKMVSWMWKSSSKDADQVNEQELKKKGFDPEGLEIEESKQQPIMDFNSDYQGYITPTPQQAIEIINSYKFVDSQDEHRHELGHDKGGKICGNKKQVSKIRSIGKEMIKLIGKKIVSGDLNLTRISFPIKAMVPKTELENSTMACCTQPYFMKKAVQSKDPVQRMKFVMSAVFSGFYYLNLFLKPLNPVIGETLEGYYPDGTKIYCEQISHHPPISYFLIVGPNQSYRYYGYYAFSAHAGLNSMTLVNKGRRHFEFKNGDVISVDFNKEIYSGAFLGTLRSEAVDGISFKDTKNNVETTVKFGKVKKRPSDYFIGQILRNGKKASTFEGTYCGYLNFDNVRYWDGRFLKPFRIIFEQKCLESDFRNRKDLNLLRQNKITEAQTAKQQIEAAQRKDAKLREVNKQK